MAGILSFFIVDLATIVEFLRCDLCYITYMTEGAGTGDLSLGVDGGQWRELGFGSPELAVRDRLRYLRISPYAPVYEGIREIPEDWVMGNPLPLVFEIRAMVRNRTIGNEDQSIVTVGEFLGVARSVYELSDDEYAELKDRLIPEALVLDEQWRGEQAELAEQGKEDDARFFAETWNEDRLRMIVEEVVGDSNPDSTIYWDESIDNMIEKVVRLGEKLSEYDESIDDVSERRSKIAEYMNDALVIVGQIVFLTPTELSQVSGIERKTGYLYLDSLVKAFPTLKITYGLAMALDDQLRSEGYYSIRNDNAIAMGDREDVIDDLTYGGDTNEAITSIETVLTGKQWTSDKSRSSGVA